MPKYPATTASLYQLQELSSDKHTCTNSGSAGNRGSQDLQKPRKIFVCRAVFMSETLRLTYYDVEREAPNAQPGRV
jgi:hypothetical protein